MKQKLLLLLLGVLMTLPALARDFEYTYEGQTLTYTVIDEDAKTCKTKEGTSDNAGNTVDGKVVLPANPKDGNVEYTLVRIGAYGFYKCIDLTSVVIPNSVTSIGGAAFRGCRGFTHIKIPDSVTYIGDEAFGGCHNLTSIDIPESVTYIGDSAFGWCQNLKSVHLPNSITEISGGAFQCCVALESIEIPNSVTGIGGGAFFCCTSLTSIKIPDSVTVVGAGAFDACVAMTKAEFSSLKSLFNIEFLGLGANPLSSAHHLYIDGKEITKIVVPDTMTSIKCGTFEGGSFLDSIVIPESVTSIGDYAFRRCSSVKEIKIPDQVTYIGEYAFANCSGLKEIKIPDRITTIEVCAFTGCHGLTEISIPDRVTNIKSYAFCYCKGLNKITIPSSVGIISNEVFIGCEELKTVVLGSKVWSIGYQAFKDCPISNIYITAPNPPKAPVSAFSDYSGTLHLQGDASAVAYGNDETWGRFKRELMIEPTGLTIDGASYVSGEPGETFQLKADIYPADVTLPYIYWKSTNPRIATVDNNGLVTLLGDEEEDKTRAEENDGNDNSCKIIAESLYYDGPIAEVTVFNSDFNGVETVIEDLDGSIDYRLPYEIYNLSGTMVGEAMDGLAKGIYIIRQGKAAVKMVVR